MKHGQNVKLLKLRNDILAGNLQLRKTTYKLENDIITGTNYDIRTIVHERIEQFWQSNINLKITFTLKTKLKRKQRASGKTTMTNKHVEFENGAHKITSIYWIYVEILVLI